MNIALGIEYNGSGYHGFQKQEGLKTVQGELEEAISKIACEPIEIFCAGRTDAAVHATGQVVNFTTTKIRDMKAWSVGVNVHLPTDIAVRWACEVSEDFHSRFSATARRYRYFILNTPTRPGIGYELISHYYTKKLDEKAMHEAAQALVGEHDFTSFRGAGCQSRTPFRNVHKVDVIRIGDYVVVDITANAFLLHMVRNIVGSLLEVGYHRKDVSWIKETLEAKNRNLAGVTAAPNGLYLIDVTYPDECNIPKVANLGPLFMV